MKKIRGYNMFAFTMRATLRISVCLGVLGCGFLPAPFSTDDANVVRSLADKFTLTSAQVSQFLPMAQGLVANFSTATNDQKNFVIQAIQDGRFGGTMSAIQTQLDTLIATAKATPAGLASAAGTTPAVGYSATGQTGSAVGVVTSTAQTYLDRIVALQTSLNGFRYQQPSAADKASIFSIIQGIFADRGDSFSDERQRFIQVLSNAQVLLYRGDAAIKPQIDAMITQLGTIVTFDIQLAYQKQLYSNFNPLTEPQKARVLKHFQEMTDMTMTLTDVAMNNEFRELLQFADVKFFQDDAPAHAQMTTLLSKVKVKDPIFSQPFATIILTLNTSAATVPLADIPAFITKVQTLVAMRYGTQVGDDANKAANSTALQNFLNTLMGLSLFSSYVPQLTVLLDTVKSDNVGASASAVVTPAGIFNVSFGSEIGTQLTQLEQSLNAINSDNNKELFILSLYDVVGRKSSATTVDVGRMRTLATNAQKSTLLGTTYAGFCNFILGGVNGDFDVTVRNQLYLDFLTRVSNMTNVVDQIQEAFLSFALPLVTAASTLSRSQAEALSAALQTVAWRTVFSSSRINDVKQLVATLNTNLGGASTSTTTTSQTTGGTTITTDATGATVLSGVTTTPSTTTPSTTTAGVVTRQQQQAASRALLNARTNLWR
jgi:hypothetical protein